MGPPGPPGLGGAKGEPGIEGAKGSRCTVKRGQDGLPGQENGTGSVRVW